MSKTLKIKRRHRCHPHCIWLVTIFTGVKCIVPDSVSGHNTYTAMKMHYNSARRRAGTRPVYM